VPESLREQYRILRTKLLSVGLRRRGTFDQPIDEVEASLDVSIVVPVHDSPKVTERCLNSIEKYGARAEVILVDDQSRLQATIEVIEEFERRNHWAVVRHSESKGHSRSCEAGARLATRPYLCLLNSDTVVTPWSWSGIKRAFESDSRIGVVGPSTSWAVTKQIVLLAEYCRHHWNDCQIWAFAQRYVRAHAHAPLVDLPQISGFAFFIRRDLWARFDGFDRNLPDYGNETELCIRLLKDAWRLVWTRSAYIHHLGNKSYSEVRDTKIASARAYIRDKHGDLTAHLTEPCAVGDVPLDPSMYNHQNHEGPRMRGGAEEKKKA